ncbi:hypothetical protein QBC37DRAFT_193336 [Rhypophila decipiens]|uniref:Secreted protein n=1 Tax=Rhypophila decipiens TaxID=261697 RepID=A0AAN7B4G8_9PEZI|nr:hypothetical protein QBC37DRAFT_193336 [Rhypophila decipiens]
MAVGRQLSCCISIVVLSTTSTTRWARNERQVQNISAVARQTASHHQQVSSCFLLRIAPRKPRSTVKKKWFSVSLSSVSSLVQGPC